MNRTTAFSYQSPTFNLNITLSNAGAFLFSETETNFTSTASNSMRDSGSLTVTVDRVGSGEGCTVSSDINATTTNVTLPLIPIRAQLGASVNVTCKKQHLKIYE